VSRIVYGEVAMALKYAAALIMLTATVFGIATALI
jgi:hypothetical protein